MAHRMSNADNFWLSMDEPTNLMVITGFMEFKKSLDFNRLYATIDSRLASFPRFQQKIVPPKSGIGVANWEEDKHFDLRSHLQRIALPAPEDRLAVPTRDLGERATVGRDERREFTHGLVEAVDEEKLSTRPRALREGAVNEKTVGRRMIVAQGEQLESEPIGEAHGGTPDLHVVDTSTPTRRSPRRT